MAKMRGRTRVSELETRRWLNENFCQNSPQLTWQEPRFGGTIGAPDVWVPIAGRGSRIGVELKVGWRDEGHLCFSMQPAQIRYHHVAKRGGDRTALLITVVEGMQVLCRVLLPGRWCPRSTNGRVRFIDTIDVSNISDFVTALECEQFWIDE